MDQFIKTLNAHYTWPTLYIFKFIVPKEKVSAVKNLTDARFQKIQSNASRSGKYVSLTLKGQMASAHAVIEVYRQAKTIVGLISL